MPDFGEILTSHVNRSGISDSEVARRVGVSRATLIRWKEGLTARPRYREDVLRCAEVLRLTPEERDELLIAADFEPESPPVEASPVEASPAEPVRTELPEAPAEPDPPPVVARRPRRLWIAVSAAVAAVGVVAVSLALINFPGEPDDLVAPTEEFPIDVTREPDHPVAATSEPSG